jgi:hypothetical protein
MENEIDEAKREKKQQKRIRKKKQDMYGDLLEMLVL